MGLTSLILLILSSTAIATELPGVGAKLLCAQSFDDPAPREEKASTRPTDRADYDLANEVKQMLNGVVNYHINGTKIDDALMRGAFRTLPKVMDPVGVLFLQSDVAYFRNINVDVADRLIREIAENRDYSRLIRLVKTLEQRRAEVLGDINFFSTSRTQKHLILKMAAQRADASATINVGGRTLNFEQARDYIFENWAQSKNENIQHLRITIANMMIPYLNAKMSPEAAYQVAITQLRRNLREDESLRGDPRIYMYLTKAIFKNLDPHSEFGSPREYSEHNIKVSGSTPLGFLGIDAVNGILVRRVTENSLAARSGLRAGDVIERINNNEVVRFGLEGLTKFLRAQSKEHPLRFRVVRDGREVNIRLDRQSVVYLDQYPVRASVNRQTTGIDLGVLRFDSFYHGVAEHVKQRIEEVRNTDGLVLDLRSNSGGSLFDASQIARLFVNSNEPMWYNRYNNRVTSSNDSYYAKDSNIAYSQAYSKPMVVLVDTASASAAEILTSSLRSFGRVIVVGAPTFGKGSSYERFAVEAGGLKITTSLFYNRFGESPQYYGVQPDIVIKDAAIDLKGQMERDLPFVIVPDTIPVMTKDARPVIVGLERIRARSLARQQAPSTAADPVLAEALAILADSVRQHNP